MQIELILEVSDPEMIDSEHETGLTSAGYDKLSIALTGSGFEFVEGPNAILEG